MAQNTSTKSLRDDKGIIFLFALVLMTASLALVMAPLIGGIE